MGRIQPCSICLHQFTSGRFRTSSLLRFHVSGALESSTYIYNMVNLFSITSPGASYERLYDLKRGRHFAERAGKLMQTNQYATVGVQCKMCRIPVYGVGKVEIGVARCTSTDLI